MVIDAGTARHLQIRGRQYSRDRKDLLCCLLSDNELVEVLHELTAALDGWYTRGTCTPLEALRARGLEAADTERRSDH